jgi:hypothetical protein
MQLARPVYAVDPRRFGKRAIAIPAAAPGRADELKLFVATFLGGFLFVSILIG